MRESAHGWGSASMREACVLLRDGTHLPPPRVSDGPFLLSVRNMEGGRLVLKPDDTRVPWSFHRQMHASWQIELGDVLLAVVGATLGKFARVGALPPFTLQRSVAVLRGKPGTLDNDYLYCCVQSPSFQQRLWKLVNQTAQPGVYLEQLGSLQQQLPPLPEQRQIAVILDTIDDAIRKSERIIAKLKQVKQGLLHDLLTCGIDGNGELRDPERHPEQFKASPLGPIPREWEVVELGSIGMFMNGLNKPKHAFGTGTKFVNISDVYPDRLDTARLGRMQTTSRERERFGLVEGDILLDRSSVKLEGVGYPTVFEGCAEQVVFCGFIIRFRSGAKNEPRFLCAQMRAASFRRNVIKVATQSANVNVNQVSLSELAVALPSQGEQSVVLARLDGIEDRVHTEEAHARKLYLLKAGLMEDLLTGRVRVTRLLESAAE
jgi:type I restriction enzyme S subunit